MIVNSFKFNTSNISPNKNLAFRGEKSSGNPLEIQDQYLSAESKNKTVTICGSSKDTEAIKDHVAKAFNIAKELVNRGYNVLTGCGDKGIRGAAYKGALSAEKDLNNPEHNLAVLEEPLWGDEDIKHCKVIGKPASSEGDRIENGFSKASNNFLVFPGGPCSLQEATTLIAKNKYRPKNSPLLNIMLVGKDYYKGLKQQYDELDKADVLGTKPENLFKIVDPEDVLKEFPDLNKKLDVA
ncbi:MAG: hypothetical protein WC197_00280 [Candidatus Gastranaerophilaceae bacterium]|jgi:predicted Rossmann-fold nucleotide-binding protein